MLNPYEVLGLSDACDPAEVKKAYRRLAQRFHPDKSKHPEAADKFKLIKEAYDYIRTGKSSTGAFTNRPSPKPPPPPPDPWGWTPPPKPSYSAAKVCVKVKFTEIFGGSRVNIPGTPYFIIVPNSVQHGSSHRLLAETINHSHQLYYDVLFSLHDPTGFHQIKDFRGKDVLYSKVEVSAADLLSGVTLYLRNINPNLSDVPVKLSKNVVTEVPEAGLPLPNGRRGIYYVEPIVKFNSLDDERFDTLIALRDKINETLKDYYKRH